MSRIFTLFGLVLVLAAGISLYQLKHRVEEKEARLLEMQGQMVRDKEAIRVLNAEWALLSSPDKLQAPGQKYLDLRPPEADQVLSSLSELPFRAPSQVDLESSFTALSKPGNRQSRRFLLRDRSPIVAVPCRWFPKHQQMLTVLQRRFDAFRGMVISEPTTGHQDRTRRGGTWANS